MLTPTLRAAILVLVVLFALGADAGAQTRGATTGRVVGFAYTANNSAIVDARVQLRNTVSGQIAGAVVSNAAGEFVFDRVPPGSYVIEMVNPSGGVMALGHPFTVAAGETVATFVRMANILPVAVGVDPWDLALGVIAAWRDGTVGPGAGVTVGYRSGRFTPFLEATGTRRDGHNDWRAIGGLRLWLKEWATARLYAHGSVGTLIRNSDAGAAFNAGLGAEWRTSGRVALRVQGDLTRDRADGVTTGGSRLSLWVVVR